MRVPAWITGFSLGLNVALLAGIGGWLAVSRPWSPGPPPPALIERALRGRLDGMLDELALSAGQRAAIDALLDEEVAAGMDQMPAMRAARLEGLALLVEAPEDPAAAGRALAMDEDAASDLSGRLHEATRRMALVLEPAQRRALAAQIRAAAAEPPPGRPRRGD
jgi:uncharacterized membrane protein